MSVNKKLISNSIYLFLDWLIVAIMSFLYWLIAGKTLLPEEYGIVSTTTNLTIVLSNVSMLGLNTAVWKLIPEYQVRKEYGKINSIIKFSLKIVVFSSLTFSFILIFLSSFLQPIIKIPLIAIFLSALIILAFSISTQFGMIIYAFQEMKRLLLTDWISQLTKVSFSAILIFLGLKYLGPIIGFFLSFFILALIRLLLIPLKGKGNKINEKEILFDFAFPAFISNISWIIFINGQYVLLTILKSTEATGLFTIAMILTSPIAVAPNTLTSALLPIISQLSIDHGTKKKQTYLILTVFKYGLLITLPITLILILFSNAVILIFSRAEYLPASNLFPILALASLIYGLGNIFLNNLYAIGKTRLNRNIVVLTTISFFILAIPLINFFSGFGLSLAYFLAGVILLTLSYFFIRKFLDLRLPLKSIGKILVSATISFSFLYFTTYFTSGLLIGIPLAIISLLIYLLILVYLKFYTQDEVIILKFFASKIKIFRKQIYFLINFLSKNLSEEK